MWRSRHRMICVGIGVCLLLLDSFCMPAFATSSSSVVGSLNSPYRDVDGIWYTSRFCTLAPVHSCVVRYGQEAIDGIGVRISDDELAAIRSVMVKSGSASQMQYDCLCRQIDVIVLSAKVRMAREDEQRRQEIAKQVEQQKRDEENLRKQKLSDVRQLIATTAVNAAGTTQGEHLTSGKSGDEGAFTRPSDDRLAYYNQLHDAACAVRNGHDNAAYASCTQAVSHVIRCTADDGIWCMGPGDMLQYLTQSTQWEEVPKSSGSNYTDVCQPGDIIAWADETGSGHDAIFVGNSAVRQRDASSDCNVYEANYSTSCYPGLTRYDGTIGDNVHVFRFVGVPSQAPLAVSEGLVPKIS